MFFYRKTQPRKDGEMEISFEKMAMEKMTRKEFLEVLSLRIPEDLLEIILRKSTKAGFFIDEEQKSEKTVS